MKRMILVRLGVLGIALSLVAGVVLVAALMVGVCVPLLCGRPGPDDLRVYVHDQEIPPASVITLRQEIRDIAVDANGDIYVTSRDHKRGRDVLDRISSTGTWDRIADLLWQPSVQRQPGSGHIYLMDCQSGLPQLSRVSEGAHIDDLTPRYFGALDEATMGAMSLSCDTIDYNASLTSGSQDDWWDVLVDGSLLLVTKTGFWRVAEGKAERVLERAFDVLALGHQLNTPMIRVTRTGEVLVHLRTAATGNMTTFRISESAIQPIANLENVEEILVSPDPDVFYHISLEGNPYDGDWVVYRTEGTSKEFFRQSTRASPELLYGRAWFMEFDAQGNFYVVHGSKANFGVMEGWWLVRFDLGPNLNS